MRNTPSKKVKKQATTVPKFTKGDHGELTLICPVKNPDEWEELRNTLGTCDMSVVNLFFNQIIGVLNPGGKDNVESINRVMPLMRAIKPTDELEGMLAVQMVGIHAMATEMMQRAMYSDQTVDGVSNNVNRVTKLTRTFIAQMEALDKHRGKGQQKITVEHVTVNKGGQAIVGNVEQGGRDESKK